MIFPAEVHVAPHYKPPRGADPSVMPPAKSNTHSKHSSSCVADSNTLSRMWSSIACISLCMPNVKATHLRATGAAVAPATDVTDDRLLQWFS